MKKLGLILLVTAFVSCISSCKNEADPEADKSFFTKFYDDNAFNVTYSPLDAVQTADGGYLVLGIKRSIDDNGEEVSAGSIYLMKTDEFGDFKSQNELPAPLAIPAPALMEVAGKYYLFCMSLNDSGVQLVEVSSDGLLNQQTNVSATYPLAAGTDGTSLLLLSFNPGDRTTVMSSVSTSGTIGDSKGFNIGAADPSKYAPESIIMDHVFRRSAQLPFFVGKVEGGSYYFNGIYNYTLSTLFTDLKADNPSVVLQGDQSKGGMSAVHPIAGGKFAAARVNFGDNYILPTATLASDQVTNLAGYLMAEFVPNAPVKIIDITINGQQRTLYGSNTRGKQIGLYGYNPTDGSLIGTRYIGFSNSFELASMKPTLDGGLLVLGTTYIAGRFPRICLFKLSAEALGKSFK